jgi:hypothetical protein
MADPVLYTIEFVASATIDGIPFTDEPLVLAGVTDAHIGAALAEVDPEVDPQSLQQLIAIMDRHATSRNLCRSSR